MLCGVPKEQTAQLALKESQLCVRMTFFHNKTAATTKSNSKEFLLQIEKSKCLLVSNRICSLPAQVDQRSVSDPGSSLVHFAQSRVVVVSGQSRGGGIVVHLKEGGDRRDSGSVQRTWIPKVRMNVCLPGDSL